MDQVKILRWFECDHLPVDLQNVAKRFWELSHWIVENVEDGPERATALRKLLEAKDAAVRSKLTPGG